MGKPREASGSLMTSHRVFLQRILQKLGYFFFNSRNVSCFSCFEIFRVKQISQKAERTRLKMPARLFFQTEKKMAGWRRGVEGGVGVDEKLHCSSPVAHQRLTCARFSHGARPCVVSKKFRRRRSSERITDELQERQPAVEERRRG